MKKFVKINKKQYNNSLILLNKFEKLHENEIRALEMIINAYVNNYVCINKVMKIYNNLLIKFHS